MNSEVLSERKVNLWTIRGFTAIVILGFLLHYVFDWSGHSNIVGAFVPVNESVWEHLKLGYWALVLFSIFEYPQLKRGVNNYFLAKTLGVLILSATILVLHYGAKAIFGKSTVWFDILTYVFGTFFCQLSSRYLYRRAHLKFLNRTGFMLFGIFGFLLVWFTYHPPRTTLFMDGRNQSFGLENTILLQHHLFY